MDNREYIGNLTHNISMMEQQLSGTKCKYWIEYLSKLIASSKVRLEELKLENTSA